ncbi:MAG: transcription antitermination factor NusB, partial [Deltaproteobacteria bacterium]|nr:transcription antitermination factor NusB [Deltaproteobacteria bacterium]
MGTPRRRHAREVALQVLFSIDLNPLPAQEALRRYLFCFDEFDWDEDSKKFMHSLVEGTCRERQALDRLITEASRNWRVSRMAAVDRNLLRMSTYEMLHHREIPWKVTLNEAVEIAKHFGTTESRTFING